MENGNILVLSERQIMSVLDKVIDPAFVALGCAELAARLALKPSRRSVAAYRRNQE